MHPGIDPRVDYAFKKLLSNPELLVSFLNAVLAPPANELIQHVDILNPFQPQETDVDKLSVLDIKARDASGRVFNIEMQLLTAPHLRERVLFYWARMYEEQLRAGDDYDELCPAVSICVCDFVLFPQTSRHHLTFRLLDDAEGIEFSNQIELHTLELEKFAATNKALGSDLDCWLYFLRNGATLDPNALPKPLDRPDIRAALGVLDMIQKNRYEHELYEARLKAQLDENSRNRWYERIERNYRESQESLQKSQEQLAEARSEVAAIAAKAAEAAEAVEAAEAAAKAAEAAAAEAKVREESGRAAGMRGQVVLLERFLKLPAMPTETLQSLSLAELEARIRELQAQWDDSSSN
jgi:predicted transposase/invertase (TIGR01784 family)